MRNRFKSGLAGLLIGAGTIFGGAKAIGEEVYNKKHSVQMFESPKKFYTKPVKVIADFKDNQIIFHYKIPEPTTSQKDPKGELPHHEACARTIHNASYCFILADSDIEIGTPTHTIQHTSRTQTTTSKELQDNSRLAKTEIKLSEFVYDSTLDQLKPPFNKIAKKGLGKFYECSAKKHNQTIEQRAKQINSTFSAHAIPFFHDGNPIPETGRTITIPISYNGRGYKDSALLVKLDIEQGPEHSKALGTLDIQIPFEIKGGEPTSDNANTSLRRISFISEDEKRKNRNLCIINSDGTGRKTLKKDVSREPPIWSPDGKQIAITCNVLGSVRGNRVVTYARGRKNIFVINNNGSNFRSLINSHMGELYYEWTDKGIYFTGGRKKEASIYLSDPRGKNIKKLIDHSRFDYNSKISPDGKSIVYLSTKNRTSSDPSEVWLRNLETGEDTKIPCIGNCSILNWSPNGKYLGLLFQFNTKQKSYIVDVKTNKLWEVSESYGRFPLSWSPDSTQIALSCEGRERNIYLWNPETDHHKRLIQDSFGNFNPIWSPDGKSIAYLSYRGNNEICIINADGSNQRRLTYTPEDESNIQWSPLQSSQ